MDGAKVMPVTIRERQAERRKGAPGPELTRRVLAVDRPPAEPQGTHHDPHQSPPRSSRGAWSFQCRGVDVLRVARRLRVMDGMGGWAYIRVLASQDPAISSDLAAGEEVRQRQADRVEGCEEI